jgi:glycosyltransferase involved in cell wall biosynthesis
LSGALRRFAYAALIASRSLRLRCYKTVSFVSRAYAQRLSPRRSAPVFYWGSELTPRGPHTVRAGASVAIYAGSLGVGYDIETVLEAATILRAEGAPVSVVIAGDGPKRGEVLRAQRDGVVDYLGQLSRDQLIEAYEKADVGLLPYQAGSKVAMPIKFFDYVNFGLYVVSSLEMEAQDLIEDRSIGVSYAPGSPHDLAAKLRAAANDRATLERARGACEVLATELAVDSQYERFARFVLDQAGCHSRESGNPA